MKLRAWVAALAATTLAGTTASVVSQTVPAGGDLTNEKIAAQLTDRLLDEIYPKLLDQDSRAVAAMFWQNGDGTDPKYDGTFVFEQPASNPAGVQVAQGRRELATFLDGFFLAIKPCSFDLHEDSVRFSIAAERRVATMFFTQTVKVVALGQGGDCKNQSTHITWVMDITRSEVWRKGAWYTINDHNVLRVATPPG